MSNEIFSDAYLSRLKISDYSQFKVFHGDSVKDRLLECFASGSHTGIGKRSGVKDQVWF